MRQGNPRVGNTAHYTAQTWVRFGYPEAGHFDTARGRALHVAVRALLWPFGERATPTLNRLNDWLHLRHHAIERRMHALDPSVVIEVGAGLSPRGLARARAHPDRPYVELDLADVVAAKRACLEGVDLPPNYHLAVSDLLAEALALPVELPTDGRALAITEGVIPYLAPPEKRRAWANLAGALRRAGGGRWIGEIYPEDRFSRHPNGRKLVGGVMGAFVGRRFDGRLCRDTEEALGWITGAGFDDAEALDLAALAPEGLDMPLEHVPFVLIEARAGGA